MHEGVRAGTLAGAISDSRRSLCRQIKAFQPRPIPERDFALIVASEMKQAGSMKP
jgi:hypothetical protein